MDKNEMMETCDKVFLEAKMNMALITESGNKNRYSKEIIRRILEEHQMGFINRRAWDEYSKKHNLPIFNTIRKYLSYDEILKIIGRQKVVNVTNADLIRIALQHRSRFLKMKRVDWDDYASEHNLPNSSSYIRHFGSWRKARQEVLRNE